MELLSLFQQHLFSQNNPPAKVTVKNYVADISRFLKWYQQTFQKSFTPQDITLETIKRYRNESIYTIENAGHSISARSFKRHESSLRKFFNFLSLTYGVQQPLNQEESKQTISYEKIFKDYLFTTGLSDHTIKNYLVDITHFLSWVNTVSAKQNTSIQPNTMPVYEKISENMLDEYKYRLLHDAGFSPVSINRKLSSLRKYFTWLRKNNILKTEQPQKTSVSNISLKSITDLENEKILPVQSKQLINGSDTEQLPQQKTYSRFPPFRLFQKTSDVVSGVFDTIFIISLTKVAARMQFFAFSAQKTSLFEGETQPQRPVSNIPKAFYAPISVNHLTGRKKIWYTLRHVRPAWYKNYHQYPIAHYLHTAILVVFIAFLIIGSYATFMTNGSQGYMVTAAMPQDPPRQIAFSGSLTDALDNPLTTKTALRFALYNSPTASAGALLWQEVAHVTPDTGGNFSTMLGTLVPIPSRLLSENPDLYLGMSVGPTEELRPRQQVATSGLAASAETLQGMGVSTETANTANVILALDSAGDLTLTKGHTFQTVGGTFTFSGDAMLLTTTPASGGNITIAPDGQIDLQKGLVNTLETNALPTAPGAVEVDDTFAVYASSSAVSALTIQQDGSGTLISASSGGIAKFVLDNNGTGMLHGDLAINGGSLTTTATSFHIAPNNAINLTLGNSASEVIIGANSGVTTVRNNLQVSGSVGLGDSNSDGITFTGRIASNLIPLGNATYNLGETNNYWQNAYLTNVFLSPAATTSGFLKRQGTDISLTNTNDNFILGGNTAADALVKIAGVSGQDSFFTGGNVGIGTKNQLIDKLQVAGNVRVGTPLSPGCIKQYDGTAIAGTCSSDMRLKKDIIPLDNILDKLGHLRPVSFKMRTEEFPQYGFGNSTAYGLIAQQVEQIFPELVTTDENGYKMVNYGTALTMLNLAGLNELSNQVNQLKQMQGQQVALSNLGDFGYLLPPEQQEQTVTLVERLTAFKTLVAKRIYAGAISAKDGSFDTLAIASDNVSVAGTSLRSYITAVVEERQQAAGKPVVTTIISPLGKDAAISLAIEKDALVIKNDSTGTGSAVAKIDREGNASFSGTLSANTLETTGATVNGTLKTGRLIADSIDGLDTKLATLAAALASASATAEPKIVVTFATPSATPTMTPGVLTPTPLIAEQEQASTAAEPSVTPQPMSTSLSSLASPESGVPTAFLDLASASAALAYVPHLQADFATIREGLMVYGYTSLNDVSVTGQIAVGGSLVLAENSINVLGATLEIQSLRQGDISFMGGLMTLDTTGNLSVKNNAYFAKNVTVGQTLSAQVIAPVPGSDVMVKLPEETPGNFVVADASGSAKMSINKLGDLIASGTATLGSLNIVRGASADTSAIETVASGSAGVGTITAGYTTRTISSTFVTENSLIYITPRSNMNGQIPYLARQQGKNSAEGTEGAFTVEITAPVSENIDFNWWIIN